MKAPGEVGWNHGISNLVLLKRTSNECEKDLKVVHQVKSRN